MSFEIDGGREAAWSLIDSVKVLSITANLGVNPSLTITAQAERAMALWPNKGEADRRPGLGADYRRVDPVAPLHPVVPEGAPGALRLPIVGVS